jgi:uncharacterized protein DUF993
MSPKQWIPGGAAWVSFLAWLNGRQEHFVMICRQQSARNQLHIVELFRLANAAGILVDAKHALARMRTPLALHRG